MTSPYCGLKRWALLLSESSYLAQWVFSYHSCRKSGPVRPLLHTAVTQTGLGGKRGGEVRSITGLRYPLVRWPIRHCSSRQKECYDVYDKRTKKLLFLNVPCLFLNAKQHPLVTSFVCSLEFICYNLTTIHLQYINVLLELLCCSFKNFYSPKAFKLFLYFAYLIVIKYFLLCNYFEYFEISQQCDGFSAIASSFLFLFRYFA